VEGRKAYPYTHTCKLRPTGIYRRGLFSVTKIQHA